LRFHPYWQILENSSNFSVVAVIRVMTHEPDRTGKKWMSLYRFLEKSSMRKSFEKWSG